MGDTKKENLGQFQHLEEDGSSLTPEFNQKCNFLSAWLDRYCKNYNIPTIMPKIAKGFRKLPMQISELSCLI